MNADQLLARLLELREETLPLPGAGHTAERHRRLMEVGREDVSLAKLAEAHWDAQAILAEAGRVPVPGALYAVWASEIPGRALELIPAATGYTLSGTKMFCSGATLVDRALLTAGAPESRLIDLDLRSNRETFEIDLSGWSTEAFRLTDTGSLTFRDTPVVADGFIGAPGWYVERPGFWHGACGPAACWAGGAAGLVDFARGSGRDDPHTLAHLGAMEAELWGLVTVLEGAGREIDTCPGDAREAQARAIRVRHLVERACTEILRRFARAYGPHPLAMREETARRYHEVDLFVRQSHAERDLEGLARLLRAE